MKKIITAISFMFIAYISVVSLVACKGGDNESSNNGSSVSVEDLFEDNLFKYAKYTDVNTFETGYQIVSIKDSVKEAVDIVVPKTVNNNNVISIAQATFYGLEKLKTIQLPDTISDIKDYAFEGCVSLETFIIPAALETLGSSIFNGCISLKEFVVSEDNETFRAIDGVLYKVNRNRASNLVAYPANKEITTFEIPTEVTTISEYAFSFSQNLTNITVSERNSFSIGKGAFRNSKQLATITLPASLQNIGALAFFDCEKLVNVNMPVTTGSESVEGFNIDDWAFANCKSLKTFILPTATKKISAAVFYGCSSLETITIPSGVNQVLAKVFEDCDKLTITLETSSVPSTWNKSWNVSNCPVVFGNSAVVE